MKVTTVTVDLFREVGDKELAYEVEIDWGYDPGRTSGPPEDCFEPSEHFEVLGVYLDGKKVEMELTQDELDSLQEKAAEVARDAEDDCPEDDE